MAKRQLLEVVDALYEAAETPAHWSVALRQLTVLVDARAAGVRVEGRDGVRQNWVGLEPAFERAYVKHYWREDPWATPVHHAPVGMVGHGDALAARATVERSAFHNELAQPFELDDLAGGLLERSAARVISFGVMKGLGHRFTHRDDQLLQHLAPHLRRALSLAERLHGEHGLVSTGDASTWLNNRVHEALRREYGLTPAEAEVAVCIARGAAPKEVATQRETSWFTVRAQLRQIFDKLECHSQRELAHRVTKLELRLGRGRAHDRLLQH